MGPLDVIFCPLLLLLFGFIRVFRFDAAPPPPLSGKAEEVGKEGVREGGGESKRCRSGEGVQERTGLDPWE